MKTKDPNKWADKVVATATEADMAIKEAVTETKEEAMAAILLLRLRVAILLRVVVEPDRAEIKMPQFLWETLTIRLTREPSRASLSLKV